MVALGGAPADNVLFLLVGFGIALRRARACASAAVPAEPVPYRSLLDSSLARRPFSPVQYELRISE